MTAHRDYVFRFEIDRELLPPAVAERVVRLELDDSARRFVDGALQNPHGRTLWLLHRCLQPLLSDFEINGLLGTHPMHLLSTEQWRTLLGGARTETLLDVGAGNGDVTAALAPLFTRVVAIETAWAMHRRLRRRGFDALRLDLSERELTETGFDVITCLNVIDRCDAPRTLLARLVQALSPSGRLVIAAPLPLSAFVYDGGTTRDPSERLRAEGDCWETAAAALAENELAALGLRVETLSRAPYLSRAWSRRPLAVLDDAIFVCKRS